MSHVAPALPIDCGARAAHVPTCPTAHTAHGQHVTLSAYWSVLLSYTSHPTEWHPDRPGTVLSRGYFSTPDVAAAWGRENALRSYTVRVFGGCELCQ